MSEDKKNIWSIISLLIGSGLIGIAFNTVYSDFIKQPLMDISVYTFEVEKENNKNQTNTGVGLVFSNIGRGIANEVKFMSQSFLIDSNSSSNQIYIINATTNLLRPEYNTKMIEFINQTYVLVTKNNSKIFPKGVVEIILTLDIPYQKYFILNASASFQEGFSAVEYEIGNGTAHKIHPTIFDNIRDSIAYFSSSTVLIILGIIIFIFPYLYTRLKTVYCHKIQQDFIYDIYNEIIRIKNEIGITPPKLFGNLRWDDFNDKQRITYFDSSELYKNLNHYYGQLKERDNYFLKGDKKIGDINEYNTSLINESIINSTQFCLAPVS